MALVNKLVGIPSHTVTHSIGGVKGDGPSGQRLHHGQAGEPAHGGGERYARNP